MKRSKKEVQPNWRPNFRIQSELPDIKPIRTGFLINFTAVVICIGLGFMVFQQELKRMGLNNSIKELKSIVQENDRTNSEALRNSREFVQEVSKIKELEAFYEAPFIAYQFLIDLAEIRNDDLIYLSINVAETMRIERRNQVRTFRIQINGQSKSLPVLGDFKNAVAALDFVVESNGTVTETISPRDENTGVFPFTLAVNFEPKGSGN